MCAYPRVVGVISKQGNDWSALLNDLSDAEGMPPRVMVSCAIGESDLDEQAEHYGTWPDVSFGMFQQTVAYANIGDQSASATNIAYVREQLFDVPTAAGIAAPQLGLYWRTYQEGPEACARYNWPARGLIGNPNRANIERAWVASEAYVGAPGPLTYDVNTSAERQISDWVCSIRTVTWMLRSVGFSVNAGQMQDDMVAAGLVSQANGLEDGSGASLAAWVREKFGVPVEQWQGPSWEQVRALAGQGPMGMGSTAWYHWVAVRANEGDELWLNNPAPGYPPPGYRLGIGDRMDRAAWNAIRPDAVIRIPVEAAVPPEPPPDGVPPGVDEDVWNWLTEARRVLDDVRFNGRQPDGTVSVNDWDRLGACSQYLTWSLERLEQQGGV